MKFSEDRFDSKFNGLLMQHTKDLSYEEFDKVVNALCAIQEMKKSECIILFKMYMLNKAKADKMYSKIGLLIFKSAVLNLLKLRFGKFKKGDLSINRLFKSIKKYKVSLIRLKEMEHDFETIYKHLIPDYKMRNFNSILFCNGTAINNLFTAICKMNIENKNDFGQFADGVIPTIKTVIDNELEENGEIIKTLMKLH